MYLTRYLRTIMEYSRLTTVRFPVTADDYVGHLNKALIIELKLPWISTSAEEKQFLLTYSMAEG